MIERLESCPAGARPTPRAEEGRPAWPGRGMYALRRSPRSRALHAVLAAWLFVVPWSLAAGRWAVQGTAALAGIAVSVRASAAACPDFPVAPAIEASPWGRATSVAAGDFDGNGKSDLAVVEWNELVAILLGNGDGTFGASIDHFVGLKPISIVVTDLDGDAKSDIVVGKVQDEGGGLSILLGKGDGTFTQAADVGEPKQRYGVAAADFNGDGKMDLAATSSNTNKFSVLLGNGNGTFGPETDYATGTRPSPVQAADFNGDGKRDLAVGNGDTKDVSIFLGNGDGTFGAAVHYPTPCCSEGFMAAVDLDTDTKVDLALSGYGGIAVLLGNGNGTFGQAVPYRVVTHGVGLGVADFNGDGKADLATSHNDANEVAFLFGRGDGAFGEAAYFVSGRDGAMSGRSIAVADFNGDGKSDVATGNYNGYGEDVTLLAGNGDGTFAAVRSFRTGLSPRSMVADDFNGDGSIDVATANSGGYDISVLLGTGAATFGPAVSYETGEWPQSVLSGDFDGDGKTDLAVANRASRTVSVLRGTGDGTFGPATDYSSGPSFTNFGTVAELSGDGKADLAITTDLEVVVMLGTGTGGFGPAVAYGAGGFPRAVTHGDFNRDGKNDLAVASYSPGEASVLLGAGDGTFSAAVIYSTGGSNPTSVAAEDLNRDGRLDLAVTNMGTNNVSVFLGDGSGAFGAAVRYPAGGAPVWVTSGDFNGDAVTDLATTGNGTTSVLAGKGDGTFLAPVTFESGASSAAVAGGDLDGDGARDLVVANYTPWSIAVLVNKPACGPPRVDALSPAGIAAAAIAFIGAWLWVVRSGSSRRLAVLAAVPSSHDRSRSSCPQP
ncbi:MAG: VCBS repeat-containing protein [Candidatus Schekmanbacteria bacterium]|nr:VCBS repeat-containing protein [Candidatus Schekmanbacteria bacterium]